MVVCLAAGGTNGVGSKDADNAIKKNVEPGKERTVMLPSSLFCGDIDGERI